MTQTAAPSPLPTIVPLPTLAPINDDILPVGGAIEELPPYGDLSGNADIGQDSPNYYTYYYYYPEETNGTNYYYYPQEYINSVKTVATQRARVTNLQNQYSNIQASGEGIQGKARVLKRGTTVTQSFVKATQSSNLLIGGLSLKVNNSWLLFVPLALFIYIWRRKKRINIDFNRYINMLLEIIL